MNIQNTFNEYITSLKEYLVKNNIIQSKKIVYSSIKKKFPQFIEKLESLNLSDNFREVIYCILKDISEIPICPVCKQNLLPLRNYIIGFQKTCSKECADKNFHSENTYIKISNTVSNKYKNLLSDKSPIIKYNAKRDSDKNYYILENYCKHGNIRIYRNTLKHIEFINESTFCEKCNFEIYESYIPTKEDIDSFKLSFNDFYEKHSLALKKSWWILYYPKQLKILKIIFENVTNEVFDLNNPIHLSESYYIVRNNLSERPICCNEDCSEHTRFTGSCNTYTKFCDKHAIGYNSSYKEVELENYIKSLNVNYIHNDREQISKELDFYFPDNKLAIEFNGCWYHCNKFKDKKYHAEKYNECLNKEIQMISIWEDDWIDKQDLIEYFIKAKLGIFEHKIGARECEIKEVSIQDSRIFLDNNHLQGYCNAKYRYGLYYNNELVEMMTFGNSRFKKGELELLRMCSKRSWNIIGGASKLFKYFLNHVEDITEVISYANCDISIGDVYNKLGFKYVHTTENWSWLYNGKRINRFNKIRFKEDELELYKCYSSGTMKFIYKNNQN